MTSKLTTRAILLLSAFAIIESSPLPITQEASAQNLLQAIFGGPNARKRAEERRKKRELAEQQRVQASRPAPRIKSATFKNYSADKLVVAKLSQLIDPITTGATQTSSNSANASGDQNPFALGFDTLSQLKLKVLPEVAETLVTHYTNFPRYRWVDENGPTEKAKQIMAALAEADKAGLSVDNYKVELPVTQVSDAGESNKWLELMRFEMELSAAVLTYIVDTQRGRIDPNRISGYHDFKRKTPDISTAIVTLSYTSDPKAVMDSYNPQGKHFKAMQKELAALLEAEEGDRITIAEGTFLKPGQSNPELRNIIAGIRKKGSETLKTEMAFELNTYRGDDEYTPELVALVRAFQKENNLAADGIVGKKTIRAMVEDSNEVKINKVLYAMERARWLPHELADKRVFINQPAYKVTYYEGGEPNLSMRVVVGKQRNQTNFFDDEIEKVEFNPSWGVPQSIITNEMLPKLRSDPSYLDRLGYQVTYNGRKVRSSSVNWYALGSTRAVGVRQPPGPKNALGQLKILFPNSHAIYMHDTPAKSLFGRDTRAFSHGCVRLHQPKEMAAAVLGIDLETVNAHISPRKNKTVFLDKPIPVHVAYFTAWPGGEAGEMQYYDDMYGRDKALQTAFDKTQKARMAANS